MLTSSSVALLASSFEGLSIHLGAPSKNDAASCWVTSLEPLHGYLPEALSDPWSMTTNVKRFCYLLDDEDGTKIRHIFRSEIGPRMLVITTSDVLQLNTLCRTLSLLFESSNRRLTS